MGESVLIWTLFQLNTPEYLLAVGFSELSEKGPLPVRISDRGVGLQQVMPVDECFIKHRKPGPQGQARSHRA